MNRVIDGNDLDGLEWDKKTKPILEDIKPQLDNAKPSSVNTTYIDESRRSSNGPYEYRAFVSGYEEGLPASPSKSQEWLIDYVDKKNRRNYLSGRLFRHWLMGGGRDYVMTRGEMSEARILPFNLKGTSYPSGGSEKQRDRISLTRQAQIARIRTKLDGMSIGESDRFTQTIAGGANSKGNLGQFTIMFEGTITKISSNTYSFSGDYQFSDGYDFDVKAFNRGLRSIQAQWRTRLAKTYQLTTRDGADFSVSSPKIHYEETSSIPEKKKPKP
ncbi:MAG: hypothetical protein AAF806_24200 [Bacteroidota bacterium]